MPSTTKPSAARKVKVKERGHVLADMIEVCEMIQSDATKLGTKLRSPTATKKSIENKVKILKFHVDRLINNRDNASHTRLVVTTRAGKPVASLADLT